MVRAFFAFSILLIFAAMTLPAFSMTTGDNEILYVTYSDTGLHSFARAGDEQCYDKLLGAVVCQQEATRRPAARPCSPLPRCLALDYALNQEMNGQVFYASPVPSFLVQSSSAGRRLKPTSSPVFGGLTVHDQFPFRKVSKDKPIRHPSVTPPSVSAVPLPASSLLLCFGVVCLAMSRLTARTRNEL